MKRLLKSGMLAIHMLVYACFILIGSSFIVHAESTSSASLKVNRAEGICEYTVQGLDPTLYSSIKMKVAHQDNAGATATVFEQDITLNTTNCVNGTYTGKFAMSDLKDFEYDEYLVSFLIGTEEIVASESCDFSIHSSKWELTADRKTGAATRIFTFAPGKDAAGVFKPGTGNEISLYVWKKGSAESEAVIAGGVQSIGENAVTWEVDMSKLVTGYGTYYAKTVLTNSNDTAYSETLSTMHFTVQPSATSFAAKTTNALEAKQSFGVYLKGLENLYGVKEVTFNVYNSSNKKVYSCKGKDQSVNGSYFYAAITMKSLNYKLDNYTIKAVVTDKNGISKLVSATASIDQRAKAGTLKATNSKDKTIKLVLKDSYLPGKIKRVQYCVFVKADGKSKSQSYNGKYVSESNAYSAAMKISSFKYKKTGTYTVYAYGYTQWGTKVLLNKSSFKISAATATAEGKSPSSTKGTFVMNVGSIDSPSGVSAVTVKVWRSGETKDAYTYTAKKQSNGTYQTTVNAKNHSYHFGTYHAKVYIKMGNGVKVKAAACTYSFKPVNFVYMKDSTVKNSKKVYIYNPSKEGKITFQVYSKVNGTDDSAVYNATTSGYTHYTLIHLAKIKNAGTIYVKVKADGTVIRTYAFTLKSSQLVKQGWNYEKYQGKTYKFYYEDGEKLTDLTDVMGIKESNSSNYNNFYVEVNRAACCVTIYAYDSKTKSYCIPVKTCTVSVGRDTWSTKGSSALKEETSFTPLGTYSVSSNGTSVKYTMKPMIEPDGSVCYARWATHVVGNVYFHSVAVSSDSHYALSPTQYNRLGSAASAGCIRMTVADAKWFYDYVSKGTTVKIIQGSTKYPGPLGKNPTIKISSSVHYDPTDPEVPLSTKQKDYKAGRISGYMTASGKKVGY